MLAAPAALFVALACVAGTRDGASPDLLPATAALPACAPEPFLGRDGGRRYDSIILRQSRERGLNPRLVKAVVAVEFRFSPRAVSRRGARGLMQVMPSTAEEMGIRARELSEPEANIAAGTRYLALLFAAARRRPGGRRADRERVVRRVLAAYHCGPRALDGGTWPASTRRYVRRVLSCYGPRGSAAF